METTFEVKIQGLTKRFGEITAVDNVSLDVPKGSIFGLLGPNGAGKSTTVRLLCTLLKPDKGTASVSGIDILQDPVEVRQTTGVLPEEANHTLYENMSAYDNLVYFARLYGMKDEEIPSRVKELLEFMGLWNRKDDAAGKLSSGNRQRVALCRAMLHEPTVLLLDEPTSSLDPIAAKRVRQLILNLSREYGQTFFINSHNLAEIERICDRVAIIDKGEILISGKTRELTDKLRTKRVFRMIIAEGIEKAKEIAEQQPYVKLAEVGIDSLVVEVENARSNNPSLLRVLLGQGVDIVEMVEEEATLEDIYLQVVREGSV
ncbi:ABC transporter ATP-binding protein [Candidatus Thorarchaeota archaeon]|nr:MAG: ABC transporter ATP-binding protein [Candidatus Thorarchaeota archaeon]